MPASQLGPDSYRKKEINRSNDRPAQTVGWLEQYLER